MRKALVVGIDAYYNDPLNGCCNDAEAIKEMLSRHEDGSPNFHVKMENNIGTKGELRRLIRECFADDEEVALFYYSGHGYIDSIGGYLVTPDCSVDNYGVSLHEILEIANSSRCKNKLIILDSCYSGYMGTLSASGQNTAVISEGVTILTASRSTQTSVEINGQGLFTSLLLEALSGGAADITGHITPGGIYAYIDKALGAWFQRPVFKTNITSFVSLRDVVPQVDLHVIRRLSKYFLDEDMEFHLDPSFEPTNDPNVKHEMIMPYATSDNTEIFSDLQKLEGIGLVVPVGEEHMYYAAMKSKSCALTSIGKQYWRLVKKNML